MIFARLCRHSIAAIATIISLIIIDADYITLSFISLARQAAIAQ